MTLSVIAAEQKFHKHSSIFSAPLLLLLNEWFESHYTFSPLAKLLASHSNVMRGMRKKTGDGGAAETKAMRKWRQRGS